MKINKKQLLKHNIEAIERQNKQISNQIEHFDKSWDNQKKQLKHQLKLMSVKAKREQINYLKEQLAGTDIILETLRKEIEND